jgi:hypothetical protein
MWDSSKAIDLQFKEPTFITSPRKKLSQFLGFFGWLEQNR